MNNDLQVFNHDIFGELKVLVREGKEYFPATEIASALGYKNQSDAISKHCKSSGIVAISQNTTEGNSYQKKYINEGNLYRLIVKSRLPEAEKFEKWVFEEVLPSIRKNGAYMTDATLEKAISDPDFMIGLLTNLKIEKQKRIEAEAINERNKPLVTFAERCLTTKESILVRELAKLATDEGYIIGEKKLYKKLREWGLVLKYNTEPSQYAMNQKLFEVTKKVVETPYGDKTVHTTKVTPKGQVYIIEKLMKEIKDRAI
jgi:prophage antirepressor-like protein